MEQQQNQNEGVNTPQSQNNDNGRMVAILSYITLIGWVIALIKHNENKTELGAFHIRQALGLAILGFAGYIVIMVIVSIVSLFASFLMPLWGLAILVLVIMGLINASNSEMKPVPVVGEFIQKTLAGLK